MHYHKASLKLLRHLEELFFFYLVFQIILVVFNKRRQKILELIRKDLNRIEKKIDTLSGMSYEKINKPKNNY